MQRLSLLLLLLALACGVYVLHLRISRLDELVHGLRGVDGVYGESRNRTEWIPEIPEGVAKRTRASDRHSSSSTSAQHLPTAMDGVLDGVVDGVVGGVVDARCAADDTHGDSTPLLSCIKEEEESERDSREADEEDGEFEGVTTTVEGGASSSIIADVLGKIMMGGSHEVLRIQAADTDAGEALMSAIQAAACAQAWAHRDTFTVAQPRIYFAAAPSHASVGRPEASVDEDEEEVDEGGGLRLYAPCIFSDDS